MAEDIPLAETSGACRGRNFQRIYFRSLRIVVTSAFNDVSFPACHAASRRVVSKLMARNNATRATIVSASGRCIGRVVLLRSKSPPTPSFLRFVSSISIVYDVIWNNHFRSRENQAVS